GRVNPRACCAEVPLLFSVTYRDPDSFLVGHPDTNGDRDFLRDDLGHQAVGGDWDPADTLLRAQLAHSHRVGLGARLHLAHRNAVGLDLFALYRHAHRVPLHLPAIA